MVMQIEPLQSAITLAKKFIGSHESKVIYMSPQGKKITQRMLIDLAVNHNKVIFVSGRYEGIDERLFIKSVDEEWSIGDYITSGGDLPVMVAIEATTRFLSGIVGSEKSVIQDSFSRSLLDFPHYTRPKEFNLMGVPKVLLSGSHFAINKWRLKQQLGRTWLRRKDLLNNIKLSDHHMILLREFIEEMGKVYE